MFKAFLILLLSLISIIGKSQDSTKHTIEFIQRYENFLENDTYRSFTSIQYGYKINYKHDLLGRLVYQNRNGESAVLSIVDFYPTYNKGYMFFSARYSNSLLFPKITLISEIYRNIFKSHEVSIGLRYLNPLNNYNIYVITGTYGIYYGNWYSYVRPMLSILDDGVGWSGMIVTRRYFGSGKSYIEAMLLRGNDTGTSRVIGSIENSFGLDTYLIRLKGNINLPKNFTIAFGTDYSGIFIPKANNETTTLNIMGFDLSIKKEF